MDKILVVRHDSGVELALLHRTKTDVLEVYSVFVRSDRTYSAHFGAFQQCDKKALKMRHQWDDSHSYSTIRLNGSSDVVRHQFQSLYRRYVQ